MLPCFWTTTATTTTSTTTATVARKHVCENVARLASLSKVDKKETALPCCIATEIMGLIRWMVSVVSSALVENRLPSADILAGICSLIVPGTWISTAIVMKMRVAVRSAYFPSMNVPRCWWLTLPCESANVSGIVTYHVVSFPLDHGSIASHRQIFCGLLWLDQVQWFFCGRKVEQRGTPRDRKLVNFFVNCHHRQHQHHHHHHHSSSYA